MNTTYSNTLEKCRETLIVGASPRRYICEIQREIYDFMERHVTDPEALEHGLNLVAEAFLAGKKMSDRLKTLNNKWSADDWPKNTDFENDLFRRAGRLDLLKNIKTVYLATSGITGEVLGRIIRQLVDYRYEGDFIIQPSKFSEKIKQIILEKFPKCTVSFFGWNWRPQFLTSLTFTASGDLVHDNQTYGSIMSNPLASILSSPEYRKAYHAHSAHNA